MTVRVCASVTACTSGILPRSPRVDVALTPSVRTLARTVPSSLAAAAVSRRSTFGSEMGRSAHGSEAGLAEVEAPSSSRPRAPRRTRTRPSPSPRLRRGATIASEPLESPTALCIGRHHPPGGCREPSRHLAQRKPTAKLRCDAGALERLAPWTLAAVTL